MIRTLVQPKLRISGQFLSNKTHQKSDCAVRKQNRKQTKRFTHFNKINIHLLLHITFYFCIPVLVFYYVEAIQSILFL